MYLLFLNRMMGKSTPMKRRPSMEGVPLDDFSKRLSFNVKNLEAAGLLKFVQLPRPSRFYKEDMVTSFI